MKSPGPLLSLPPGVPRRLNEKKTWLHVEKQGPVCCHDPLWLDGVEARRGTPPFPVGLKKFGASLPFLGDL